MPDLKGQVVINGEVQGSLIPVEKHKSYRGSYSVTPSKEKQTLETDDLVMRDDVTVNPIPDNWVDTDDANAAAGEILSGKSAYVHRDKVTGTMPNREDVHYTISDKTDIVEIPAGYHNGEGTVMVDADERVKLIPENIRKDVRILGVEGAWQPPLQHKTVDPGISQQVVEADNGYYGLSGVTVDPVALEEKIVKSAPVEQVIRPASGKDGISKITVQKINLEERTVKSSGSQQVIVPNSGKDGIVKVTVEPVVKQAKAAHPAETEQVITPDSGYDGLSQVTVEAMELEEKVVKSTTSQQEITPTSGKDGIKKVTVSPIVLEEKSVKSTETEQEITPASGKDAISKVTVQALSLEEKTVKSTETQQEILPATGKDGIKKITVSPIIAENKTVKSGNSQQTVNPGSGKDYIKQITVEPVELQAKTVNPGSSQQTVTPDQGKDGLSSVVVTAIPATRPDVSQDTATEADVASGKTFHKADGTQATGTASSGGGGSDAVIVSAIENDPEGTLMDFNIPASVGTIGQGGLFYCANFVKTIYGENVRVIKGNGIYCCTRLTSVRFGGRVESLEAVQDLPAIGSCFSLTAITGLENIYWLGRGSFDTLSALEYLRIGFKLKPWASGAALSSKGTVGKCIVSTKAFIDFYALKTLCFDASGIDDLTKIEISSSAIFLCDALTDIYVSWPENAVASAPWGATNATIHYNTQFDANGDPIV